MQLLGRILVTICRQNICVYYFFKEKTPKWNGKALIYDNILFIPEGNLGQLDIKVQNNICYLVFADLGFDFVWFVGH